MKNTFTVVGGKDPYLEEGINVESQHGSLNIGQACILFDILPPQFEVNGSVSMVCGRLDHVWRRKRKGWFLSKPSNEVNNQALFSFQGSNGIDSLIAISVGSFYEFDQHAILVEMVERIRYESYKGYIPIGPTDSRYIPTVRIVKDEELWEKLLDTPLEGTSLIVR